MKVIVCGGRDFDDRNYVWNSLESFHLSGDGPIDVLIHGGANGADSLAAQWAQLEGVHCIERPADWKRNGKAAGPIRKHNE